MYEKNPEQRNTIMGMPWLVWLFGMVTSYVMWAKHIPFHIPLLPFSVSVLLVFGVHAKSFECLFPFFLFYILLVVGTYRHIVRLLEFVAELICYYALFCSAQYASMLGAWCLVHIE